MKRLIIGLILVMLLAALLLAACAETRSIPAAPLTPAPTPTPTPTPTPAPTPTPTPPICIFFPVAGIPLAGTSHCATL